MILSRSLRRPGAAALGLLALAACSPGRETPAKSAGPAAAPAASAPPNPANIPSFDPPAGPGSVGPALAAAGPDLLLTWVEPSGDFAAPIYQMRLARFAGAAGGTGWSTPVTVARGADLFANWADFPGAVAGPGGEVLAHWLVKHGETDTAQLARSTDGGATWKPLGPLQADPEAGEHGFVSYAVEDGGFRAFWLEGSEGSEGGRMSLRSARIPAGIGGAGGAGGSPGPAELLDDRVCYCCQTAAAPTAAGTVVVYRDRSEKEIRDISLQRKTAAGWTKPVTVGADGWEIPGCPVNGPAVAAAGKLVVVAWFTAAPPGPRVELAFSTDAGASFGPKVVVDGGHPMGRVDVKLVGQAAVISWVAPAGPANTPGKDGSEKAAIWLRRVQPAGPAGPPFEVPGTRSVRASAFPRLGLAGDHALLAWVDDGEPSRLRASLLPLAQLP